jgi:hypothetical protein
MDLEVNGARTFCYTGGKAFRCGQADRGLHPRRAQRPQRLDPADALLRAPRLERAGRRPARPLQERRRAAELGGGRCGLRAGAARRGAASSKAALVGHSFGSLDRAGSGGARAGTHHAHRAGRHRLPDEGHARLAGQRSNQPEKAIDMVNVFSHSMMAPPPSALGPGTWLYGGSRALMRACSPATARQRVPPRLRRLRQLRQRRSGDGEGAVPGAVPARR